MRGKLQIFDATFIDIGTVNRLLNCTYTDLREPTNIMPQLAQAVSLSKQEFIPWWKRPQAWRAAVLLGLSEPELSRLSSECGFGHTEVSGQEEETFFTYEELRQICLLTVNHVH